MWVNFAAAMVNQGSVQRAQMSLDEIPPHDHRSTTLSSLTWTFLVANKIMQIDPVISASNFYSPASAHISVRTVRTRRCNADSIRTPLLVRRYGKAQMVKLTPRVWAGSPRFKATGRAECTSWASSQRSPQIRLPMQLQDSPGR